MGLSEFFAQPVVIMIGALLAALLAGGGLGALAAWLLGRLFKKVPGLRLPFIPLPWSTIFFALCLAFFVLMGGYDPQSWFSAVPPGLGFMAIILLLVAAGMLLQWAPSGAGVRLLGLARTATVLFSIVVILLVEAAGANFLTDAIEQALATSPIYDQWIIIGFLLSLGLILDILLGVVQMLVAYRGMRKMAKEEVVTEAAATEAEEVAPVG